MHPPHALIAGAVLLAVAAGGWLYADHLRGRVDELTVELRQAIADKQAAERGAIAVADEAASAAVRVEKRNLGRDGILTAPESENGPVMPVLERAFRAADEIGGIK